MLETNGVRLIINSNGVSTVSTYLLGGGLAGLVTTGSLKGMLIGAVSGAVFAGIGNAFSAGGKFSGSTWVKGGQLTKYGKALKTGLHGVAGGARSVLSGGKFKAGFLSAGFTQLASPAIGHAPGGVGGELVAAGVVGGVGSELAGGKFEDGFVTGVFSHGFNALQHDDARTIGDLDRDEFYEAGIGGIKGFIGRGAAWIGNGLSRVFGFGGRASTQAIVRSTPGADGAMSAHLVESSGGSTLSVTHQVTNGGRVIHQHQTHIGRYGGRRQFPDEWVKYPEIP